MIILSGFLTAFLTLVTKHGMPIALNTLQDWLNDRDPSLPEPTLEQIQALRDPPSPASYFE